MMAVMATTLERKARHCIAPWASGCEGGALETAGASETVEPASDCGEKQPHLKADIGQG